MQVLNEIKRQAGPWGRAPLLNASIIIKFGLSPDRFRDSNDLDNLAKLVLDALSLEVTHQGMIWRAYGIIRNHSDVLDLFLIKRVAKSEYVSVSVWETWDEPFLDAIVKELKPSLNAGSQKKYVVFEDLYRATGPKAHSVDCTYYKRWLNSPTSTTTWHGPYNTFEEAWRICEELSKKGKFKSSKHGCIEC